MNGRFLHLVSEVLHKSIESWSDLFMKKVYETKCDDSLSPDEKKEEIETFKLTLKQINTATKAIETTTFIKNVIEQIVSMLVMTKEEQEKLNYLDNYLNFRNGKLNLKTNEFSERTEDDFITEYLNYDFQMKPKKEVKKEVAEVLKKICNSSEDDYEFITNFLSYCITSETKEQKYLNVVGPSASNGKSTLIKLMEEALSIYIFKAKKDLFSEAFSKGHKYFSQTKNKRIVYIEELDKKKVDADLIKDVVDGNKMNNEVLFSTTEKIDINFKLMFLSNNLMNFDADSGIKRRLIHFEFKNKFVEKADLEKEKANHKIGEVYVLDKSLVSKFHDNDDYKNALIHVLIKKAKNYFESGLVVPDKYIEMAKDVCEENDKFKNFFDNHFEISNNKDDKISKDEIRDMYNRHTKCNFSASSIMTDIQRLQLNYEKGNRVVYNGISIRGIVVGIKKKSVEYADEEVETKNTASDLDFGLEMPCEKRQDDDLLKKYNQSEKELNELKADYEKMRLEFEAYKKEHSQTKKSTILDDSDEEGETTVKKPKRKDDKRSKMVQAVEALPDFID
jgi:phage/plasmid-associated DNA primase